MLVYNLGNPTASSPGAAVRSGPTGYLLDHSLGKIRDTYVNLGSKGIMANASQETSDWVEAAIAGQKVKVREKFAKAETAEDRRRSLDEIEDATGESLLEG
jgi:hypothetical protein